MYYAIFLAKRWLTSLTLLLQNLVWDEQLFRSGMPSCTSFPQNKFARASRSSPVIRKYCLPRDKKLFGWQCADRLQEEMGMDSSVLHKIDQNARLGWSRPYLKPHPSFATNLIDSQTLMLALVWLNLQSGRSRLSAGHKVQHKVIQSFWEASFMIL